MLLSDTPTELETHERVDVRNPLKSCALFLLASNDATSQWESSRQSHKAASKNRKTTLALMRNAALSNELNQAKDLRITASKGEKSLGGDPMAAFGSATQKKVLIVLSDTGGGHRASAKAIAEALQSLYPNKIKVEIVDIWTEYGKWPFNTIVAGYAYMAKHPWTWKLMYEYASFPPTQLFSKRVVAMRNWGGVKRCLEKEDPDLVISVHPLCNHLPLRILNFLRGGREERRERTPFVTVVTDLGGGMAMWFHNKVDMIYVPSRAVERLCRRNRVPKDKIRKFGLPIRPGFKARDEGQKKFLQFKLGLRQGMPTALIIGGGDGVGKLKKITKAVANQLGADGSGPRQLVVLCGKNKALRKRLNRKQWPDNVHVKAVGWMNNMDEWFGAVDCLITKAGPGTIAEGCASGLPMMLSSFLPGQEAGNVKFVVDQGFGAFSTRPKKIAKIVSGWLKDPELLAEMSKKSHSAGRPDATKEIAADIGAEFLFPTK